MIRRVITQEVVEIAAGNEGWGDQFMTVLLDQLTDEVCKSISPKVVEAAAGNQAHGEQIMTILLNRLKYEVCRSISEEVVKVAAGNRRYGAQIMEKLLKFCGDVVCEDFSFAAACTAAENGKSGVPILDLLLQADEEKVSKLMLEVYSRAEEGGGLAERDPPEAREEAEEDMQESNYIGYPKQVDRCSTF